MNIPKEIPPRWLEQIRQIFAEELEKASKNELQNKVAARFEKMLEREVLGFIRSCSMQAVLATVDRMESELRLHDRADVVALLNRLIGGGFIVCDRKSDRFGIMAYYSMDLTSRGEVYLEALESELGE